MLKEKHNKLHGDVFDNKRRSLVAFSEISSFVGLVSGLLISSASELHHPPLPIILEYRALWFGMLGLRLVVGNVGDI